MIKAWTTSLTCLLLILSSCLHCCSLQLPQNFNTDSPTRNDKNVKDLTLTRRDVIRSFVVGSVSACTTAVGGDGGIATASDPSSPSSNSIPTIGPKLLPEYYNLPSVHPDAGRSYFPALTPPFKNRATYRYDLGRNAWAFEQLLTFANVTATIRCNVIKLQSTGGLWVHSPQWPTGEFCKLLDECGTVEHVVLPCNAFEHKAPMQAFIEKYQEANVWVAPGQYGPLGSCETSLGRGGRTGMPYKVDGILGDTDSSSPSPPWLDEFDMSVLYVDLPKNAGPVSEVAFCHRPTKTLISTDAVVFIPPSPPDILSTYFDRDVFEKDPTFWPRSVLQAVFLPLRGGTSRESDNSSILTSGDVSYPGYDALAGRLVRAPILRAVVDARAPGAVRDWIVEQTDGSWKYDRIISSHFASPVQASPADVKSSFEYLFEDNVDKLRRSTTLPPITCQDWELLDSINQFIKRTKTGEPAIFPFQRGCI